MKGIIQQSQLTEARGELAVQGGIFRAPLQAAIEVPGRFGPSLQLETDDRGTIVAPERVGTTGQNAVIMLQSLRRGSGSAFQSPAATPSR